MFFYGEDSVTDNLSPYIDAAPREEQKYFLATQQVDEARHAVFFARFFREVIGVEGDYSAGLAYTLPQLNWSYRQGLRPPRPDGRGAAQGPLAAEVRAGDRALPHGRRGHDGAARVSTSSRTSSPARGSLPGFSEGMKQVSRDEQRHIGFGVKTLSDCFAESDECKAAVVEILREVYPFTVGVFTPPNWDREYTRCYGFEIEDIFVFGLRSVEAKWRAAGYPLTEMPSDVLPLDWDASPEERAANTIKMLEAGVVGQPVIDPDSSADTQERLFTMIARSVDHSAVNGKPITIQWRFSDADPWHVTIDNGSTAAVAGESPRPDITFESSWREWLEVTTWGGNPTPGDAPAQARARAATRCCC